VSPFRLTEASGVTLAYHNVSILSFSLGPTHPKVAATLENYAKLLRAVNRKAEASKMDMRAKAIRGAQK